MISIDFSISKKSIGTFFWKLPHSQGKPCLANIFHIQPAVYKSKLSKTTLTIMANRNIRIGCSGNYGNIPFDKVTKGLPFI